MARSDDNLPGLGLGTLRPRLASAAALQQKSLSQNEGYVLSRVDGVTTLREICLLVPMRRDDTLRILRRLRADGIIEVPGSLEPMPPSEKTPAAPPARSVGTPGRPQAQAPARSTATPPRAQTPAPARSAGTPPRSQTPTAQSRGQAPASSARSAEVPQRSPGSSARSAEVPQRPLAPASSAGSSGTPGRPASGPGRAPPAIPTPPELLLLLDDEEPAAAPPARPAPLPPDLPVLSLELEEPAAQPAERPPRPASPPSPVPSLRSSVSPRAVLAAQPAADGSSRSRAEAPRPASKDSPDLSDLSLFQPGEPRPEVEVIGRSSRASGLIDDTRPSRRTEPPRPSAPPPSRTSVPSTPPQGRPAPAGRPELARTPIPSAPPGEDACELSPEQRRRIDEVYAQVNVADYFTLLGVTLQDDRKAVQRAYFKLSKEFHPDRFFKKQLGVYKGRIASVFQAITEARDILVDEERRARYLAGD
jgi:hypothetical protein